MAQRNGNIKTTRGTASAKLPEESKAVAQQVQQATFPDIFEAEKQGLLLVGSVVQKRKLSPSHAVCLLRVGENSSSEQVRLLCASSSGMLEVTVRGPKGTARRIRFRSSITVRLDAVPEAMTSPGSTLAGEESRSSTAAAAISQLDNCHKQDRQLKQRHTVQSTQVPQTTGTLLAIARQGAHVAAAGVLTAKAAVKRKLDADSVPSPETTAASTFGVATQPHPNGSSGGSGSGSGAGGSGSGIGSGNAGDITSTTTSQGYTVNIRAPGSTAADGKRGKRQRRRVASHSDDGITTPTTANTEPPSAANAAAAAVAAEAVRAGELKTRETAVQCAAKAIAATACTDTKTLADLSPATYAALQRIPPCRWHLRSMPCQASSLAACGRRHVLLTTGERRLGERVRASALVHQSHILKQRQSSVGGSGTVSFGDGTSAPAGLGRQHSRRGKVFGEWLVRTFGLERLRRGSGIIDVAGGKQHVSRYLAIAYGLQCTVVDPRQPTPLSSTDAAILTLNGTPHPAYVQSEFDSGFCDAHAPLVHDSAVVIGQHPDEATEPIVREALRLNRPFAIVPCCVFPGQFPRKLQDGRDVRQYDDFVEYLLQLASGSNGGGSISNNGPVCQARLDMGGRNTVIYRLPKKNALNPTNDPA
eukprot:UC1_evm2s1688